MHSRQPLICAAFCLAISPLAGASFPFPMVSFPAAALQSAQDDTHAKPALIAATTTLSRGTPNLLAITFAIDEHWHLYADAQNDTGQAPKLKLDLPAGVTATPMRFPPAKRLIQGGSVLDHIYEEELTLLFHVTVSDQFKGDSLTIKGTLDWLECADVCRFGKGNVALTIPIAQRDSKPVPSADAKHIAEALKALPVKALPPKATIELTPAAKPTNATITVPGAKHLTFTPDNNSATVTDLIKVGEADGDTLKFSFETAISNNALSGVLEVRNGDESQWYHFSKALGPANQPGPKAVPEPSPPATPAPR